MPKKGPRSEELWLQIRAEWERGASKRELASKYNITTQAIYNHEKRDGWEKTVDVIDEIAGIVPDDEPVIIDADPLTAAAVAKIAELEAKLEASEAKVKEYKPTAEVRLPSTPEGWVEFLGEENINNLVELEMATENTTRFRKGLPPLNINDNPELKKAEIKKLLDKREAAKTKHVSLQHVARTVKVMKPNGNMAQIIVEGQVSNEAGQAGTAMWKARDKGFKLVSPYLCQALNCWLEAEVNDAGKLTYQGYCSAAHMALDPYIGKKEVAGVTTSSMGIGSF